MQDQISFWGPMDTMADKGLSSLQSSAGLERYAFCEFSSSIAAIANFDWFFALVHMVNSALLYNNLNSTPQQQHMAD